MRKKERLNPRILFLFQKYIKNECTPEELDELLNGLNDNKIDSQIDFIMRSLWKAIKQHESQPVTDEKIKQWRKEIKQLLDQTGSRKHARRILDRKIQFRPASVAAAAVILLLISIGTIRLINRGYIHSNKTELARTDFQYYQVSDTGTKQIDLPDGSRVLLNSNTKLHIEKTLFNRSVREIWIDEGEAFFEVAKDPAKPFIVHNRNLQTRVKGTSFNVKAYPILGETVVTVRTGLVEVTGGTGLTEMLRPGEQITFNTANNSYQIHRVKWQNAVGWTDGRLALYNANVKELGIRLKQQFGVVMELRDRALEDVRFNAAFAEGATINNVMDVIGELYSVSYRIDGNRVIISAKKETTFN